MRRTILLATLTGAMLAGGPARADDVTEAIAAAQRAYQAGQFRAAQTALQEALQHLGQRAADALGAALPAPLPGWTAEEATSSFAGAAGVFGAATASRTYRNAAGQSVEIEVMSDNPMIAQLGALLSNPMLAGAMGRVVRIGEQRAIQGSDGDIQMLVADRVLVQVKGDAAPEQRLAYARAIDFARLAGR